MYARPSLILALTQSVLLLAVACASPPSAFALRSVPRCGFTSSPYGTLGIYVQKGRVNCRRAAFLIHRAFYITGQPSGLNEERYPDGWICGGQMGVYVCSTPSIRNPTQEVEGLACHMGTVRCPKATRKY
jgi:hypothetical protein